MTPEEKREIEERVEKMTREEACKQLDEIKRIGSSLKSNKIELARLMHERHLVGKKCET